MGLTLACRRSAIIDFAANEECGVYKLRAKGEQREQPELVEKIPETAPPHSDSETPPGRWQAHSLPVPLEICEGEKMFKFLSEH